MTIRTIVLELDEEDFRDINAEFATRQARSQGTDGKGSMLPYGDSNLAGVLVGEIVRDLWEYRSLAGVPNPPIVEDRKDDPEDS